MCDGVYAGYAYHCCSLRGLGTQKGTECWPRMALTMRCAPMKYVKVGKAVATDLAAQLSAYRTCAHHFCQNLHHNFRSIVHCFKPDNLIGLRCISRHVGCDIDNRLPGRKRPQNVHK